MAWARRATRAFAHPAPRKSQMESNADEVRVSLSRADERALEASRAPDFYRKVAHLVLQMDEFVAPYKEILAKGKALNTEFLESTWPGYHDDVRTLYELERKVRTLEPTLTGDELLKIFDLVRGKLESDQTP